MDKRSRELQAYVESKQRHRYAGTALVWHYALEARRQTWVENRKARARQYAALALRCAARQGARVRVLLA